jgi:hypothetical protein
MPFPSHHGSCLLINQILGSRCWSFLTKYAPPDNSNPDDDPQNTAHFPTFPDISNLWKVPSTYDSELHLQFYSVLVGLFILAMHLLGRATSVEAARLNCTEQSDSLVLCDECH